MDSHEYRAPLPEGVPQEPRSGRRARRRGLRTGIATAAVVALGAGWGLGAATRSSAAPDPVTSSAPAADVAASGSVGSGGYGWGGFPGGGRGGAEGGAGSGTGTASSAVGSATDAQQAGIVDIDVVLGATEQAAGTGMVLTSTGEVLTNRHVVQGETSISVTVPATGRTYAARVVGISTTTDVAVVQLVDASGLDTVRTASIAARTGDTVVGVGNAGGTGGRPSAATGTVTAVGQSITASESDGSNPERLTGLIETDAAIEAGDSGGPLFNSSGQVVGMDTAGSASASTQAFAIPIKTALAAAKQIESSGGDSQSSQSQGNSQSQGGTGSSSSAFLGIQATDAGNGVQVAGVVDGSPAAVAGLAAGDTITAVDGRSITSVTDLAAVMQSLSPGQQIDLVWVDGTGQTQESQATLVSVPTA